MSGNRFLVWSLPLALAGAEAGAFGLGGLQTQSALNQPFLGEIELIDVAPDALATLRVGLASPEEFARAGAEYYHYLSGLRFTPQVAPDGRIVLRIASREPIREPYMDFLIEVVGAQGRLVKGYTVLLDPPVTASGAPRPLQAPVLDSRPPSPVTAPAPRPAATSSVPPAVAPTPGLLTDTAPARTPAAAASETSGARVDATDFPIRIGPIAPGLGLWRLVRRNLPAGATEAQTAMALYRNNQAAFIGGDIDRLVSGQVLTIPSRAELFALDAAEAEREFVAARRGEPVRRAPIVTAASAGEPDAGSAMPATPDGHLEIAGIRRDTLGSVTDGAASADMPAAPTPPGVERDLLLALEASESARQETLDLRNRIRDLETQLTDIQRLLELRTAELAQLRVPDVAGNAASGSAMPPPETAALAPEPTLGPTPQSTETAPETAATLPETPGQQTAADLSSTPEASPAAVPEGMPPFTEQPPEPASVAAPDRPETAEVAPVPPTPPETPETPEPAPATEPAGNADMPPAAAPPPAPPPTTPKAPAPRSAPAANPLGDWLMPLVGGSSLIALLVLVWILVRRRRAAAAGTAPAPAPTAPESPAPARPLSLAKSAPDAAAPVLAADAEPADAQAADQEDAIAEAEIYLAYGRHDEAIRLLRDESARTPDRWDLRLKLAEAYWGAGRTVDLDAQLLALRAAGIESAQPEAWSALLARVRGTPPAPELLDTESPTLQVAAAGADRESILAQSLDPTAADDTGDISLELPELPDVSEPERDPFASLDVSAALPTLDERAPRSEPAPSWLDPGPDSAPPVALGQLPEATGAPSGAESVDLEFQPDFALPPLESPPARAPAPALPPTPPAPALGDSQASDFLSSQWEVDSSIWDENATKLDLARAYLEMEDTAAAREILEEVLADGGEEQRREAKTLLGQLGSG